MARNLQRSICLCVQCAILVIVVFAFLPGIGNPNYSSDDYVFLGQVKEHGLAESLLFPFYWHFIPLYRLIMGGLHLLFDSAIPIRIVSLGFHLLNTYLVFRIVYKHTKSSLLSAIASLTFGLSVRDASDIFRCVNGHWAVSLFFVLMMAVYLERFHDSYTPDSRGKPPDLKYYFAGLAFFVVGLGVFTNVLFAGTVVWLFAYARLLLDKTSRQALGYHAKIVAPFFLTVTIYLLMRQYFSRKFFSSQSVFFHVIEALDSLTYQEKLAEAAHMPPEFYLNTLRQLSPYFLQYGTLVLAFLVLLLVKEIAFRRKEIIALVMWLTLALATFVVMWIRYMDVSIVLPDPANPTFPSRYLYYPEAGLSIAIGLLLRPPPSWESAIANASRRMRITLFAVVAVFFLALNFGKVMFIRSHASQLVGENLQFHQIVIQYRESMATFLHSPAYSVQRDYYFKHTPAADAKKHSSSFTVMQADIFHMYFPGVGNIHFIYSWEQRENLYVWTPDTVMHP